MYRALSLATLLAVLAAGVASLRRGETESASLAPTGALPPATRTASAPVEEESPSATDDLTASEAEQPSATPSQTVLLRRYHDSRDPAARAAALSAFRAAEPDNALGPYLAAAEAARSGDPMAAAAALVDVRFSGPMRKDDWALVLAADSALRAKGKPDAEALAEAMGTNLDPRTTQELLELGKGLGELQRIFVGLGEWDEADFLLEAALDLGADLRAAGTLRDNLAGAAVERALLEALDPETVVEWDGERAGERLDDLDFEATEMAALAEGAEASLATLDAAGWGEYRRRLAEDGERAALRWARDRR